MDEKMVFNSFYQIPCFLIEEERFNGISSDAKLLYGLILSRLSLSIKNKWLDNKNRVYIIYTIESVKKDLKCSTEKAVKVLAELDTKKGVGLIERIHRGLGKPDMIYVNNVIHKNLEKEKDSQKVRKTESWKTEPNFNNKTYSNQNNASVDTIPMPAPKNDNDKMDVINETDDCLDNIIEDMEHSVEKIMKVLTKLDPKKSMDLIERIYKELDRPDTIHRNDDVIHKNLEEEKDSQKVGKTESWKEKPNSRVRKNRVLEFIKPESKYINNNYINKSNINHINQSENLISTIPVSASKNDNDKMDKMDEINTYVTLIRDNLDYDCYKKENPEKEELFEQIYELICDVVCVGRKTIRIGREDYPYELVKSRFLKLNSRHVKYVMDCMKSTTTKITNIRSYLITALYNAPSTIIYYYQQRTQHNNHNSSNYINTKQDARQKPKNSFNEFEQQDYDFEQLEKELLEG